MNIVLFVVYIIMTVGGLMMVKLGGSECSFLSNAGNFEIILNTKVIAGLFMYMTSFLIWMYLVSVSNLTIILPLSVGIVNVLVLLISSKLFDVVITPYHWAGVIFVIIGIALMTISKSA